MYLLKGKLPWQDLPNDDEKYSKSMMAFALTIQTVLKNALECLGIDAPTFMEKTN